SKYWLICILTFCAAAAVSAAAPLLHLRAFICSATTTTTTTAATATSATATAISNNNSSNIHSNFNNSNSLNNRVLFFNCQIYLTAHDQDHYTF
ncbi:hypothetical protein CLOM_g18411, partial [Closterium sp. NIES-68]